MKTAAVFFPFDLFGSAGAGRGAELLADAVREMLDDNRQERRPIRARAYQDQVRLRQIAFATQADYQDWRSRGRQAVQQALRKGEFLFWITGNHLGALPLYDELAELDSRDGDTLVIQLDAHLDIYNLHDCTAELSHGNFLLHVDGRLPALINAGHRELLLRPEYIRQHYRSVHGAAELAIDAGPALEAVREASRAARRVFLDIDCDVLDPAYFPAVANPVPFGLSPRMLLRFLDAAWSDRVAGVALSEFTPARDREDQCLATLLWLIEYLLLRRHEAATPTRRRP